MTSRVLAAVIGLAAGLATLAALKFDWVAAVTALRLDRFGIDAAQADGPTRLAWALAGGVTGFAAAVLLVALIGGLVETAKARRGIHKLRHDPELTDRWGAADWRAVFTATAIADQAEAMIALSPIDKGDTRRVVVDTTLLLGLNRVWLDRLTLAAAIGPLPALLLGMAATLALFAYATGGNWTAVAAAGTGGWLMVSLGQYLVRAALAPAVDGAVSAATAAIRPLSSVQASAAITPPAVSEARIGHDEAEIIAAALSHVIWEPLGRLAEAAEKLNTEPQSRDQAIETAMAEVRADIEKLLSKNSEA